MSRPVRYGKVDVTITDINYYNTLVNYYWNLFQISSDFFCTTVARRRSLSNLIERRIFGAGVYII